MSAEQPYTPSEARVCIDYCNAVVARRKADPSIGMAEADAEFDRFIEAVKRDAARSALGGLAEQEWKNYAKGADQCGHARHAAQEYRDTHYPEETP